MGGVMRRKWRLGAVGVLWLAAWVALPTALAAAPEAAVRTFEITASKYVFTPATIEVNQGDRVKLVLRSTDVTHGIEIKEFGVKTEIPKGGQAVTVEFTADKAGAFEFKCSHYCGMGHRKMKGRLVVTARAN
jgi:cytochrome c oxidase subunit II